MASSTMEPVYENDLTRSDHGDCCIHCNGAGHDEPRHNHQPVDRAIHGAQHGAID